jgi:hypothetical protein
MQRRKSKRHQLAARARWRNAEARAQAERDAGIPDREPATDYRQPCTIDLRGAAIAAQSAAHVAYKRCQDEQQYFMDGTRAKTCANANAPKLHEAVALMEKATRLLLDARDRQARMLDA